MIDRLENWLAEDVGRGDVTSQIAVPNVECEAEITGGPAVISGLEICNAIFTKFEISAETKFEDGDYIEPNVPLLNLIGYSHEILKIERLVLNLLCHLSGIATFTSKVVREARTTNPNVEILATRKTTPGLRDLEKYAVLHGGGQTHRMRLDDAILIKDNHLTLSKDINSVIRASKSKYPNLLVEAEADDIEQALQIARAGANRVLLDNFTPDQAKLAFESIRSVSDIEIEISGGITIENVSYFSPFADFISLGALTMSSPSVDFSLHVF